MTVIDLEILISASPEFIWRFLGDLSALPQWQEGVEAVSFLSTQHEGRGARWRTASQSGRDTVAEIAAWYDRLGYEYRLVDGSGFGDNQGRIRLQEVAEGTLVRWTFHYETSGVLSGLRNNVRLKRSVNQQIQASLYNLKKLISQQTGGISTHEAKAIMREAPAVEEREHYQPRYPSAMQSSELDTATLSTMESQQQPDDGSSELDAAALDEPAIAEQDTKPNPVVITGLSLQTSLNAVEEAPPAPDDTQPLPGDAPAPPQQLPQILQPAPPARKPPPVPRRSSETVSVFEVFGLQKPSEITARQPLSASAPIAADDDLWRRASESRAQAIASAQGTKAYSAQLAPEQGGITGFRRQRRRGRSALRSHVRC